MHRHRVIRQAGEVVEHVGGLRRVHRLFEEFALAALALDRSLPNQRLVLTRAVFHCNCVNLPTGNVVAGRDFLVGVRLQVIEQGGVFGGHQAVSSSATSRPKASSASTFSCSLQSP